MLHAAGTSGYAGIADAAANGVRLSAVDSSRHNAHFIAVFTLIARLKKFLRRHSQCRSAIKGGR